MSSRILHRQRPYLQRCAPAFKHTTGHDVCRHCASVAAAQVVTRRCTSHLFYSLRTPRHLNCALTSYMQSCVRSARLPDHTSLYDDAQPDTPGGPRTELDDERLTPRRRAPAPLAGGAV